MVKICLQEWRPKGSNKVILVSHMIFSCTNPCTDTFCTSSALPLKNPQSVANLKKATCVVRSDSIMGVTL